MWTEHDRVASLDSDERLKDRSRGRVSRRDDPSYYSDRSRHLIGPSRVITRDDADCLLSTDRLPAALRSEEVLEDLVVNTTDLRLIDSESSQVTCRACRSVCHHLADTVSARLVPASRLLTSSARTPHGVTDLLQGAQIVIQIRHQLPFMWNPLQEIPHKAPKLRSLQQGS